MYILTDFLKQSYSHTYTLRLTKNQQQQFAKHFEIDPHFFAAPMVTTKLP